MNKLLPAKITGYEGKGVCYLCGGKLTGRRTSYCCDEHRQIYYENFSWQDARKIALERSYHRCQRCGIGDPIWYTRWSPMSEEFIKNHKVEVHHIDPIEGKNRLWNMKNMQSNLAVLCKSCHKEVHRNGGTFYA